jgi:hypothetical protein
MKHLKKFESFSLNEEELLSKARKFFTGYEDKEDKNKSKLDFISDLDKYEEIASKNPDKYVFNRDKLEKMAKSDSYKGSLKEITSRRNNKIYINYIDGETPFDTLSRSASKVVN